MTELFQNLLVSCPNGGGLFLAHNNNVFKLDNVNTVGLWATEHVLLRGAQPETLWVHAAVEPSLTQAVEHIADIHDVLEWMGHYYVIGTTKNEVLKLAPQGQIVQRWTFPGEDDSMHLNCLGIWNGRVVFSAFGDFSTHRGYKGMTQGSGFVQDLESGTRLIHGLSQPHSLVEFNGNLLVANSECRELREYSPQGECVRNQVLDGYTRGICQANDLLYVGLSRSRNIDEVGIPSATVLALDAVTWEERGRIELAPAEVYSVVFLKDTSMLLSMVSAAVSYSGEVRREQMQTVQFALNDATESLVSANQVAEERAEQLIEKDHAIVQIQSQLNALTVQSHEKEELFTASANNVAEVCARQLAEKDQAIAEVQLQLQALALQSHEKDELAKQAAEVCVQQLAEKDEAFRRLQLEVQALVMQLHEKDELLASAKQFSEGNAHQRVQTEEALARAQGEAQALLVQLREKDELIVVSKAELLVLDTLRERARVSDALLQQRQEELAQVRASTSWKLTKPVRLVGHLARGNWRGVLLRMSSKSPSATDTSARVARLMRAARYAVHHYGSLGMAVRKTVELYRKHGLSGIRSRAGALLLRNGEGSAQDEMSSVSADFHVRESEVQEDFKPLVSVIVPNYNHGPFLRERLESIYAQTYTNIQVILLDDLSTDDSRSILSEFASQHADNTQCVFNEINSGGVFHQWKKGLKLARGELVWIAESDDYCSPNFLAENVRNFSNEAVMLSYSRSLFVTGVPPRTCWSTEEYLSFLGADFWLQPFTKSAHWLVNNCFALKNIVPNVSSAVFRNPRDMALMEDEAWTRMKVCGDWVFYLNLVRGGLVSYTPQATNYYRQHDNNTSVRSQSTDLYYREYEYVATQLAALYDLQQGTLERLQEDVRRQWDVCRPDVPLSRLDELFDLDRVYAHAQLRKPNLMIVVYALAAGGGETFPLMLANLMKRNGYGVTVLNCHEEPTEPGVRAMLQRDIPLFQLKQLDHAPLVISDLGIEVIHSHHAWVDITFASLLLGKRGPGHVVSLHGMYEMMPAAHFQSIKSVMERGFHRVVYTAEKNLEPFSAEFRSRKGFVRIDNALPLMPVNPIGRAELGIGEEDFVLCLVSRAIPEKGWTEAVEAVRLAQSKSERKIHLLLVGEGPEYDALLAAGPIEGVHLLGFKKNIRDYFALADVGFLPSRFKGESYPLVLIDCLHAGTPLLASAVGEIHAMLVTDEGMAGKLFDLVDWQIPVPRLADLIADLAGPESETFKLIQAHVPAAAHKFDPDQLFRKYDIVYGEALNLSRTSATKDKSK